ncbi:unnamed protein product [Rodentolepis nana]|uniref:Queuosine 5'-phosphate N-glycosylase/hydrolase n=1 Tax=Rodentolepis nana TaxID=102285 RepID=A0A3P7SR27_RODNA|nr:unnamed protein product [Rodentolepis nana]
MTWILTMVSNLVKLAAVGAAASFIGYCIYFDHKRRSDPNFRAKLIQKRKEQALAAQKASIPQLPSFNDPRAVHKFFLDQISAGETALAACNVDEAVTHFAYAIVVCGQPTHLLQVLQASLSPNIFSKVVSALPEIRKVTNLFAIIAFLQDRPSYKKAKHIFEYLNANLTFFVMQISKQLLIFLTITCTLCSLCASSSLSMFSKQETVVKSDENNVGVNPVSTSHVILVRSIWNQIQSAFPDDFTSSSSIEAEFFVKLNREDILILKRFVEHSPGVSPESVNEIFSRFLFPSDIKDNDTFELTPHHFLFALPFVFYLIYLKFGLILLIIMTVLCIASYELYLKGVAKRHALISRLPSLPEHCLPYSQQSILTKLSSFTPFVNSQDECIKYFELQMTPLFADLRPDRIIFLVFQDFAESFGSTIGDMSLGPRESARFIAKSADHVKINLRAIPELAEKFYESLLGGKFGDTWDELPLHPRGGGAFTANWVFVLDSLNFSFWTDKAPKYMVEYKSERHTGYPALCAVLNRAIDNGINLVDPKVLVGLTKSDLEDIFKSASSSPIPLLDERLEILHTNGKVLLDEFGGCFTNCLKACDGSAAKLIQLVCEKFPSFRDEATYKGQKVLLYKRVQILVADLWLAFKGESYGHFKDIDNLTAFADYRVPQVLNFFKVLEYDEELMTKLKNHELLESKSALEVEIRGCCLQAVELLNEATKALLAERGNTGVVCNSIIADNFLWLYRRKMAKEVEEGAPMHRTRCIFY